MKNKNSTLKHATVAQKKNIAITFLAHHKAQSKRSNLLSNNAELNLLLTEMNNGNQN